jgi:hypothetical protein
MTENRSTARKKQFLREECQAGSAEELLAKME